MAKIIVRNLTKRYGDAVALDNISLEIGSGEFLVLLGPSGCGKTTLLRCLAGLETPDTGQIFLGEKKVFDGESKINIAPGKREVGMVFQSYALWPHLTVRDNLKFGLDVLNIPIKKANARLDKVLSDVGLSKFADRYPSELSGGQQQRVALARLLATEPNIFLMDEPLSNLDARLRMDMRVELKRFQAETNATTVYVTHDQTEAMTMSTQVVVMNNGKIEQVSAPQDLYRYPETTFVADFVGMPRINLIKLKEDSSNGTRYGNGEVSIDLGWSPGIREIVIGARPEDLILSQGDEAMGEEYEITAVMPNGPETFVQLARGNTAVLARADNDTKFKTSDIVHVGYNPKSINIYDTQTNSLVPYRGPK